MRKYGRVDRSVRSRASCRPRLYCWLVLAVAVVSQNADDPLSGLYVGERPVPDVPDGWTTVSVRAATLNHHDLFSLRGVGLPADRLPMILGCDAAGVSADGEEVIVHAVIGDPATGNGDETLDPRRSLLSERYPGTLAETVAVPRRNLVPKPAALSFEEAACLPTAWLTAYRMVVRRAGLPAAGGGTLLVQGAGGGVSTAAIILGKAAGHTVLVTSRDATKRERAIKIGADEAFEPGVRLPVKVDAVIETVGTATWEHSMRALRPGGRIVCSGATSGANPPADLNRLFFLQLSVIGSTMGTRDELAELAAFADRVGVRPIVDDVRPLADARASFAKLAHGKVFGKLVLTV
ncbi:alcohol dehydrogenase zinc-binding domain-containing protein [Candidatus Protofrankia californiensis]|uniref:Alcohol dehydrogenase zinc-binding domain-containing protein n=1 Tax=Candidatus Protofrankia californiensis TaxID=1839754 RepID=A0A1C3NVQ6_9ACTN|nr:alcohol dehydrogenase zinc-binding domain-containing protein [Candidatus Protofrankia californiensis]